VCTPGGVAVLGTNRGLEGFSDCGKVPGLSKSATTVSFPVLHSLAAMGRTRLGAPFTNKYLVSANIPVICESKTAGPKCAVRRPDCSVTHGQWH